MSQLQAGGVTNTELTESLTQPDTGSLLDFKIATQGLKPILRTVPIPRPAYIKLVPGASTQPTPVTDHSAARIIKLALRPVFRVPSRKTESELRAGHLWS